MFACASGNVELVQLLIQHGADVNYASQQASAAGHATH